MGRRLAHLATHNALLLVKHSFALPKLLYCLRTSPCILSPGFQGWRIAVDGLPTYAVLKSDLAVSLPWIFPSMNTFNRNRSIPQRNPENARLYAEHEWRNIRVKALVGLCHNSNSSYLQLQVKNTTTCQCKCNLKCRYRKYKLMNCQLLSVASLTN